MVEGDDQSPLLRRHCATNLLTIGQDVPAKPPLAPGSLPIAVKPLERLASTPNTGIARVRFCPARRLCAEDSCIRGDFDRRGVSIAPTPGAGGSSSSISPHRFEG